MADQLEEPELYGADIATERLRRSISVGLSSIKSSFERGVPGRALEMDPVLSAAWKRSVLKIESIRVDYMARTRPPRYHAQFAAAVSEVHEQLSLLLDDHELLELARRLKYRPLGPMPRESGELDPRLLDRGLELLDVIAVIVEITRDTASQSPMATPGLAELRRIVPAQKIAPVQFDIADGKIVVVDQPSSALEEDAANIAASRDALVQSGSNIISALEQSNCDRRLLESVKELQIGLNSGQNIISLGLSNISCEAVCSAFKSELPDALCGKLQGHTRGVSMYLAQFPEWQKFSEKAASVDLDKEDIRRIANTAKTLVAELFANPTIADPEVPRTIAALEAAIADPKQATKRAAFAVLRTIENLVAKAVEYGAKLIDSTINKTIAEIASVTGKAIAIAILSLALSGATGVGPVAVKVTEAAWLKSVAQVVRSQLGGTAAQD